MLRRLRKLEKELQDQSIINEIEAVLGEGSYNTMMGLGTRAASRKQGDSPKEPLLQKSSEVSLSEKVALSNMEETPTTPEMIVPPTVT